MKNISRATHTIDQTNMVFKESDILYIAENSDIQDANIPNVYYFCYSHKKTKDKQIFTNDKKVDSLELNKPFFKKYKVVCICSSLNESNIQILDKVLKRINESGKNSEKIHISNIGMICTYIKLDSPEGKYFLNTGRYEFPMPLTEIYFSFRPTNVEKQEEPDFIKVSNQEYYKIIKKEVFEEVFWCLENFFGDFNMSMTPIIQEIKEYPTDYSNSYYQVLKTIISEIVEIHTNTKLNGMVQKHLLDSEYFDEDLLEIKSTKKYPYQITATQFYVELMLKEKMGIKSDLLKLNLYPRNFEAIPVNNSHTFFMRAYPSHEDSIRNMKNLLAKLGIPKPYTKETIYDLFLSLVYCSKLTKEYTFVKNALYLLSVMITISKNFCAIDKSELEKYVKQLNRT